MSTNKSKFLNNFLSALASLLFAMGLSAVALLNFPSFYQQDREAKLLAFSISCVVLFILALFALKSIILPFWKKLKKTRNLVFVLLLSAFLVVVITVSSNYFWSVPTTHQVEICFDADDGETPLVVPQLSHSMTNHLFSPKGFEQDHYPIVINSGECKSGTILSFYRRVMRYWNVPGMTIFIREPVPNGRLGVTVNGVPSVIQFDQAAEDQIGNEINITDGFDSGVRITSPWDQPWFLGLKVLSVAFSAAFLALFLFGFTELLFTYSPKRNLHKKIRLPFFKQIQITKPPLYIILLTLTILYFITFSLFMVYTSGQPDQAPHRHYAYRYSETWGIPEEQSGTSYVVTDQPYLAYWIYGAVHKIFRFAFPSSPMRSDHLWRFTSVFISSFTIIYMYKLAKKATNNPYAGVLAAFLLSNIITFVFISGGISYDNLMNLAGAATIYHLVSLYKKEDFVRHSTLTGFWVIVGSLAKEQFLLMTLIIFLAWLFFSLTNFRKIKLDFNRTNILLSIVFVIALSLFIGLYGVNLIRYSRPTPTCNQIKGIGNCSSFSYRSEFYNQVSLPGLWFKRDSLQNLINYAFDFWIAFNIQSIWGIFSHKTFVPVLATALHSLLLFWWFVCLVRYWKLKDPVVNLLIYILVGFVGFMFVFNYKQDLEYGFRHYAVSGRYHLPVIGALITLMVYYFLKLRNLVLRRITVILAIMIYFSGGLWMYLSRYSEVFIHWRIFYYQ